MRNFFLNEDTNKMRINAARFVSIISTVGVLYTCVIGFIINAFPGKSLLIINFPAEILV